MPKRGCGDSRKINGIYAMSASSPDGMPIEYFMFDPTIPVDPEELRLSAVGMSPIEDPRTGVVNVWDWIGETHYPYATDYIEEGLRYEFSALMSPGFPFELLTPGRSMRYCVHPGAVIANATEYAADRPHLQSGCYKNIRAHDEPDYNKTCISFLWEMIDNADLTGNPAYPRQVRRHQPSFTYLAYRSPERVVPQLQPGLFLRLPISRFEVVAGDKSDERIAMLREKINIPVLEVEE